MAADETLKQVMEDDFQTDEIRSRTGGFRALTGRSGM